MGCVASKLGEEEEVVSICRERKRLIKLAGERRYALAEAHCRYFQAMYAVSAAIKLFVARHSSPSSPFLINFPPPNPSSLPTEQNIVNNPLFLEQKPPESTHEAIACGSCDSSSVSSVSSEEQSKEEVEREEQEQEQDQEHCGYFYMQMPPLMPSPQRDFGWDFFNPFDGMRTEILGGYNRSCDDDLKVVREEEGIPELEDERDVKEEEKNVVFVQEKSGGEDEESEAVLVKVEEGIGNGSQGEQKGLTVIDNPENGRELLEALKDIEDHFIRACDSGKDVSRMLEANMVHLQTDLDEIKENSTKKTLAITWHRSISSKPPTCKSLVATTSKSSSTWTEFRNDLFSEYGGMDSGSHSSTLGRLYAWEKKLYEEVKAGDDTRKIYEKKCSRLRNQDVGGYDELTLDKTRAAVKDLYARILVAVRCAESISKRIETLRDEELQPQLVELLKGLTRTWRITLECHETQNKILFEVKSFACPTYGKFCNDAHRLATLQLEAELQNWRACFTEYIAAQRAYVEVLHGWLAKFTVPEVEFYSRGRSSAAPCGANGPPLLMICQNWLACLKELPDRAVAVALKSLSKDVMALWAQQGEEQQQKRKVESMAKELDRKALTYQKAETRFLESKLTEQRFETETEHSTEYIQVKRDHLHMFRKRLEIEKEKHQSSMQETLRITLNGFQTGFSAVFETLTAFAKASQKMHNDLVIQSENVEKEVNQSYIEGYQVKEKESR